MAPWERRILRLARRCASHGTGLRLLAGAAQAGDGRGFARAAKVVAARLRNDPGAPHALHGDGGRLRDLLRALRDHGKCRANLCDHERCRANRAAAIDASPWGEAVGDLEEVLRTLGPPAEAEIAEGRTNLLVVDKLERPDADAAPDPIRPRREAFLLTMRLGTRARRDAGVALDGTFQEQLRLARSLASDLLVLRPDLRARLAEVGPPDLGADARTLAGVDGPSAGIPYFVALLSVITGIRARWDVALTGKLALRPREGAAASDPDPLGELERQTIGRVGVVEKMRAVVENGPWIEAMGVPTADADKALAARAKACDEVRGPFRALGASSGEIRGPEVRPLATARDAIELAFAPADRARLEHAIAVPLAGGGVVVPRPGRVEIPGGPWPEPIAQHLERWRRAAREPELERAFATGLVAFQSAARHVAALVGACHAREPVEVRAVSLRALVDTSDLAGLEALFEAASRVTPTRDLKGELARAAGGAAFYVAAVRAVLASFRNPRQDVPDFARHAWTVAVALRGMLTLVPRGDLAAEAAKLELGPWRTLGPGGVTRLWERIEIWGEEARSIIVTDVEPGLGSGLPTMVVPLATVLTSQLQVNELDAAYLSVWEARKHPQAHLVTEHKCQIGERAFGQRVRDALARNQLVVLVADKADRTATVLAQIAYEVPGRAFFFFRRDEHGDVREPVHCARSLYAQLRDRLGRLDPAWREQSYPYGQARPEAAVLSDQLAAVLRGLARARHPAEGEREIVVVGALDESTRPAEALSLFPWSSLPPSVSVLASSRWGEHLETLPVHKRLETRSGERRLVSVRRAPETEVPGAVPIRGVSGTALPEIRSAAPDAAHAPPPRDREHEARQQQLLNSIDAKVQSFLHDRPGISLACFDTALLHAYRRPNLLYAWAVGVLIDWIQRNQDWVAGPGRPLVFRGFVLPSSDAVDAIIVDPFLREQFIQAVLFNLHVNLWHGVIASVVFIDPVRDTSGVSLFDLLNVAAVPSLKRVLGTGADFYGSSRLDPLDVRGARAREYFRKLEDLFLSRKPIWIWYDDSTFGDGALADGVASHARWLEMRRLMYALVKKPFVCPTSTCRRRGSFDLAHAMPYVPGDPQTLVNVAPLCAQCMSYVSSRSRQPYALDVPPFVPEDARTDYLDRVMKRPPPWLGTALRPRDVNDAAVRFLMT